MPAETLAETDAHALEMILRLGGEPLLDRLTHLCAESAAAHLDAARRALDAGDRAALAEALHALRGGLAQLGARPLCALLRDLEHAGSEATGAELRTQLDRAEAAVRTVLGRLQSRGETSAPC